MLLVLQKIQAIYDIIFQKTKKQDKMLIDSHQNDTLAITVPKELKLEHDQYKKSYYTFSLYYFYAIVG